MDGKEAKYRTLLMSTETRQRWAVEQRSIELQYKWGTEELKHQQTADWAAIWREELFERILHPQQVRRKKIWREEASQLKKLEAGRRRLANKLTIEHEGTLMADELEDISQYRVMMTVDPQAVAGSHIATKFASERRRKQPSDGRERSPRPKKRSRHRSPA